MLKCSECFQEKFKLKDKLNIYNLIKSVVGSFSSPESCLQVILRLTNCNVKRIFLSAENAVWFSFGHFLFYFVAMIHFITSCLCLYTCVSLINHLLCFSQRVLQCWSIGLWSPGLNRSVISWSEPVWDLPVWTSLGSPGLNQSGISWSEPVCDLQVWTCLIWSDAYAAQTYTVINN